MTARRTRKVAAKAVEPAQEEPTRIPQEELENFFTDPTPEEVEAQLPPATRKEKSIPITNKAFLQEEDLREWDKYRNFLYDQGVGKVRHKRI